MPWAEELTGVAFEAGALKIGATTAGPAANEERDRRFMMND
jgi:hypothetical protein